MTADVVDPRQHGTRLRLENGRESSDWRSVHSYAPWPRVDFLTSRDDSSGSAPARLPHFMITTTSLADEIAYRLQAEILDGVLVPGAHLQQEELCARFGVSRTPVREALRKLQAQHLVQVIPNRGAMVRVPTRRDLQEIYVVRAELEGLACALAAPHMTADTIAQLAEAQEGVEAAIEVFRGVPMPQEQEIAFNTRITQANEKFHGIIHQTADNEQLRTLINQLQWYFPKDAVWKAQRSSVDIRALNLDEHRAIQDALAGRSGTKARKAMKSHILHAGSLLLSYLDELGFWS